VIGEVLGNYRVIAKLGAGGMGTVWTAEHQLLGSHAAIKVLLPDLSKQGHIVRRFFDEARAATKIRDPGIVTVLDFGWHHGDAYIVMELLVGETLTQRLGVGRLAPLQAVRLIQMCGLAMAAAHARGIIHRDIKPDNIFIVADPAVPGGERIKILDFGIAKLLDREPSTDHESTVTGAIMGTPAYMSPEQCRGAGEIDHRTDIYALGCVLFHLLTGRPPFIAPTPGDMIASQLREEPPTPSTLVPGLAPEVDTLVLRCLAKDPELRFATMTELVRAGAEITGDNHALATIPPMVPGPRVSGGDPTVASLPPTPAVGSAPSSPSGDGQWPVSGVVTTLHGSAASLEPVAPVRRRYGLVALLVLLAGGGITAAVIATSHGAQPAAAAPVDAHVTATIDASITAGSAPVVDAPPAVDAVTVDAASPRDAGVRSRDAGAKMIVTHPRVDAGGDPGDATDYYKSR
jgi:serine/threonine-protein kinase